MPGDSGPLLDRAQIIGLLDLMADEARRRGVRIDLFLVGGGAMALAYNTARSTRDLDGVFEPKIVVYEIAAAVAHLSELDLAEDWLNDGVKGFLPGPDSSASLFYERDSLSVRIASPRYLFVLKAMSGRESDEDDLRTLYPLCGFASPTEALDTIETAYPTRRISPSVQYVVEGIAGAFDGAGSPNNDPWA